MARSIADTLPELEFGTEGFDQAVEQIITIDKQIEELSKGQITLPMRIRQSLDIQPFNL